MDCFYNQCLCVEMFYCKGLIVQVFIVSLIDYFCLKEDLGVFYCIFWQECLQFFLILFFFIESIFLLELGYQDLVVLINIWLGEFFQVDNIVSDFDNVMKGNYEFDNEMLCMLSVMFVYKFKDFKVFEKLWIGFYNKEGLQVIKWLFIEYILVEIVKKLYNECEQ